MATLFSRNGIWYISYCSNGRRHKKSTRTENRRLAEIALKDLEIKLFKDQISPDTNKKPHSKPQLKTFFRRFSGYIEENYTPSHVDCELGRLRVWQEYLAASGVKLLSQINLGHVQDFFDIALAGRAARTKKNYLALLKSCLNRAVDWQVIESNPIARAKPPRIVEGKFHFFSTEEVKTLLEEAAPTLRIAIELLVNTGVRRGELWALRWRDIDMRNRRIHIRSHDNFTTKSRKDRSVPMNESSRNALKSLKRGKLDDPVYRLYSNKEMLRQAFTRLLRKLEMKGRLHDLRHTFASHLIMSGASLPVVKELLGHASITTTMIYAHLSPDIHATEVEKLPF